MQPLIPFVALEVSKNSKIILNYYQPPILKINIMIKYTINISKHRMIIFKCQPQWPGKIIIFMLRYQQLFTNPLVGYIRPLI